MQSLEKAKVLIEELPCIQKYSGKTIVVKYGGNAMLNDELKESVIKDLILMKCFGVNVVVFHGGGPEINSMLKKTGKESKFIDGLRYTDEETMDIVQMVLAGKVNKDLVALINNNGGRAVGLCGVDGNMLKVEKLEKMGRDYGYVGNIKSVDTTIITDNIKMGYIPVIATVGISESDGKIYNINADTATAKVASELKAEKLIVLTDVPGILKDASEPNTLIPDLKTSRVPRLIENGIISGGMIPKVKCCVDAVKHGVKNSYIIDGRVPHSVLLELFSNESIGTMIG